MSAMSFCIVYLDDLNLAAKGFRCCSIVMYVIVQSDTEGLK